MHDNDPKHTSRLISNWLDEKEKEVLDYPPQSPIMNHIEAVWALVKLKLGKLKRNELKEKITEIWYSIPNELIQNYVISFHKRCLAVFNVKGNSTKY
ncbi:TCB1 [Hepatospora eriocheir]|uniref:TCB1 n=1 Tax=Hepatospora eriocheir TaxID=1081669 RepID=A0A1X0QI37_9MICR|nr:TCB1 [Hepatospora eriocheir]